MSFILKGGLFLVSLIVGIWCFYIVVSQIQRLYMDKTVLYPLILFLLSIPSSIYHIKSIRLEKSKQVFVLDSQIKQKSTINIFFIIFHFLFAIALMGFILFIFSLIFETQSIEDLYSRTEDLILSLALFSFFIAGGLMAIEAVKAYIQRTNAIENEGKPY